MVHYRLGSGYVISRYDSTSLQAGAFRQQSCSTGGNDSCLHLMFSSRSKNGKEIDSGDNQAILIGGFTQAPVFISVEANASGERIENVSLVIDGETSDELILSQPSYENVYNFAWVPLQAGDFSVFAIVRDVAGNVISTEENTFSVEDYKGAES